MTSSIHHPEYQIVQTTEDLVSALQQLSLCTRVALDTEGNSQHVYRARLCVVQLCEATNEQTKRVYIIDPMSGLDITPLSNFLSAPTPLKVVHDVAFDARLLASEGMFINGVVDTAIHARLLGLPATGLGALLSTYCGVFLGKNHQQDNWGKRPFTPDQLHYLCLDVCLLGPLAHALSEYATKLGITEEVQEETEYILHTAKASARVSPPYARVKGSGALSYAQQAILRELAEFRETLGEHYDVPVGRVVPDAVLLAIAKSTPRNAAELRSHLSRFDRALDHIVHWMKAIERGHEAVAAYTPEIRPAVSVPSQAELLARKSRELALQAFREAEGKLRSVPGQVILPGHVVTSLAKDYPRTITELANIPGFGAARTARYGERILAILAQYPLQDEAGSTGASEEGTV